MLKGILYKISKPCIVAALLLSLSTACKEEDSSLPVPEAVPTVRVLFASSGLGDLSYNDNLLRGILEAQKENYFKLEYTVPKDEAEAEQVLRNWQKEDDPRLYFNILAASEFEDIVRRCMPANPANNYLLFDTKADNFTIPVFHFTGYGISFLAGIAAYTQTKAEKAAYLGGQQHEVFIEECYDGFRDGYLYAGGKEVIETYLSVTQQGFAMPQRAYEMADSLYAICPFVYAMAGNSNNGVYQYLRDYPENKYTAGVDTDQSAYSTQIIGSMIKQMGLCVKHYITSWMRGEQIPMREWYTLKSEYMSFRIAAPYKALLDKVISENLQTAIQKESDYEKGKQED